MINLRYKVSDCDRPKLVENLKKRVILPKELLTETLCSTSNVVFRVQDYYARMCSLLIKLVHNHAGVKKMISWYKRAKQSTVRRKKVMVKAKKRPLKILLKLLLEQGLIHKVENKGYITSPAGHDFLLS